MRLIIGCEVLASSAPGSNILQERSKLAVWVAVGNVMAIAVRFS